ncbi:SDR family oxidoreductase [Paenibacillus sp. Marseille-P2973]|nr:SDR family oxidoreductase [Paenibacillus sp. Marseille-P2973]
MVLVGVGEQRSVSSMELTALVTGADHGVGLALVETLLKQGSRVFAGRYQTEETALEELQLRYQGSLTLIPLDIGSDESVQDAAKTVRAHTDRLDILINNAGILGDIEATVMDELNYDEMLKVFNVNALGALRMTQAFVPLVLNSASKMIANISSEAGSIGQNERSSWFGYCMSKAALNMGSSLVYNGLKEAGGRVLLIHPGWVQTFMRGEVDASADLTPAESAAKIISLIMERIGQRNGRGLGSSADNALDGASGKAFSDTLDSANNTSGNVSGDGPEYIDVYGNPLPW